MFKVYDTETQTFLSHPGHYTPYNAGKAAAKHMRKANNFHPKPRHLKLVGHTNQRGRLTHFTLTEEHKRCYLLGINASTR